jgi:beta-lactamase class A
MIIYSDNNAAALVTEVLGKEKIINASREMGVEVPENTDGFSITVKTYSSFFRILFNASYLDRETSEAALGLLAATEFNKGITRDLPSSIKVAHKFGERNFEKEGYVQLHDCGIVYYPEHPYLICVMSRGKNFYNLEDFIATVSKELYLSVDREIKKIK